ncbi:unnamed protein product [Sphenostylis stenocarpa]|uniref:Uncharacterized protein n=1 Tax=Sphenostylis stenocarpa TaxID=92480 RepID=A0AA86SZ81_9FABA|nr:unnamed protein product [Sphenostylis stenocarpa]
MDITCYGCFLELHHPHRYDELCREEKETLKIHGKVLGKMLKKVVTAFSKRMRMCRGGAKKKERRMQFEYDPKSYAFNFDDGIEEPSR